MPIPYDNIPNENERDVWGNIAELLRTNESVQSMMEEAIVPELSEEEQEDTSNFLAGILQDVANTVDEESITPDEEQQSIIEGYITLAEDLNQYDLENRQDGSLPLEMRAEKDEMIQSLKDTVEHARTTYEETAKEIQRRAIVIDEMQKRIHQYRQAGDTFAMGLAQEKLDKYLEVFERDSEEQRQRFKNAKETLNKLHETNISAIGVVVDAVKAPSITPQEREEIKKSIGLIDEMSNETRAAGRDIARTAPIPYMAQQGRAQYPQGQMMARQDIARENEANLYRNLSTIAHRRINRVAEKMKAYAASVALTYKSAKEMRREDRASQVLDTSLQQKYSSLDKLYEKSEKFDEMSPIRKAMLNIQIGYAKNCHEAWVEDMEKELALRHENKRLGIDIDPEDTRRLEQTLAQEKQAWPQQLEKLNAIKNKSREVTQERKSNGAR